MRHGLHKYTNPLRYYFPFRDLGFLSTGAFFLLYLSQVTRLTLLSESEVHNLSCTLSPGFSITLHPDRMFLYPIKDPVSLLYTFPSHCNVVGRDTFTDLL